MEIVSFIDVIYHTRDVSACIVILEEEQQVEHVRRICEAKLYPVNTVRFVVQTWDTFRKGFWGVDIQDYDLIIMSRHIPFDRIVTLVRMNSVVFIL